MPRSRRRSRSRTSEIIDGHIMALSHGHDFFGELHVEDADFETNVDKQREVWDQVGDRIMLEWMARRDNVGIRPYGWWAFSCPGPVYETESEAQALLRLGQLESWEIEKLDGWDSKRSQSGPGWRDKKSDKFSGAYRKTISQRSDRADYIFNNKLDKLT